MDRGSPQTYQGKLHLCESFPSSVLNQCISGRQNLTVNDLFFAKLTRLCKMPASCLPLDSLLTELTELFEWWAQVLS